MTLGAYIIVRNEQELLQGCVLRLLPFVDEILIMDHGSTDRTRAIIDEMMDSKKITVIEAPYQEPVDMGALRTECYRKMTSDWVMTVDADEYYPPGAMATIKDAIDKSVKSGAISFRVRYHNLAWRIGYRQGAFEHAPDRLYRRDVVDFVGGVLPNDMVHVKTGFYTHRPFLEYDNQIDKSFDNPKQPILDAWYFHLARTRGYNFEYTKWLKYQNNIHPNIAVFEADRLTRINQWVSGLYMLEPMDGLKPHFQKPPDIPLRTLPNPKVSVIIPNFQYKAFVGEAIKSALDQTVKPWEIIVVDDGSHDDSISEIRKYPVTAIPQRNAGVAAARNNGIARSTGDYFICLDADDKMEPTFIEKTLAAMVGDIQVVYANLKFFGDQDGGWDAPEPSREAMREWQIVPSTCALVDRRCFEASGGFDPAVVYEDWDFWLNLMIKQQFKFAHVKEPLFLYRKHGPSRINELDKQQVLGFQQLRERYGITRQPDPGRQ